MARATAPDERRSRLLGSPAEGHMGTPRLLIIFTLATLGVVLIVAALTAEEWWLLPIAVLAHATATLLTVAAIGATAKQKDKPDPVTEARVEEEARESQAARPPRHRDDDEPRMAI